VTDLKTLTDIELVQLFIENEDKKYIGELYTRHIKHIYRFVYSKVGNRIISEDITSETFFTFIEVIRNYNQKTNLRYFLFGIAFNKVKQSLYNNKHNYYDLSEIEENLTIDEEIESYEISLELKSKIANILKNLPENYRDVLVERFVNTKSIKEAAKTLNISEENIRVIQHRALKKALEIANKLNL
jgi:RNA polymerase sigma-70 factor (ECF subfamily)